MIRWEGTLPCPDDVYFKLYIYTLYLLSAFSGFLNIEAYQYNINYCLTNYINPKKKPFI